MITKTTMKKIGILALSIVLLFALTACDSDDDNDNGTAVTLTGVTAVDATTVELEFSDGSTAQTSSFTPTPLTEGDNTIDITYDGTVYEGQTVNYTAGDTPPENSTVSSVSAINEIVTIGQGIAFDDIALGNVQVTYNGTTVEVSATWTSEDYVAEEGTYTAVGTPDLSGLEDDVTNPDGLTAEVTINVAGTTASINTNYTVDSMDDEIVIELDLAEGDTDDYVLNVIGEDATIQHVGNQTFPLEAGTNTFTPGDLNLWPNMNYTLEVANDTTGEILSERSFRTPEDAEFAPENAPEVVEAMVEKTSPRVIGVEFSQLMDATSFDGYAAIDAAVLSDYYGFTAEVAGEEVEIVDIVGADSDVETTLIGFLLATVVEEGETVTLSYDAEATAAGAEDAYGNALESFTTDVVNETVAPKLGSAVINNETPKEIVLEFNTNMQSAPATDGLVLSVNGAEVVNGINNIANGNNNNKLEVTLANSVKADDTVSVEYVAADGSLADQYDNPVKDFTKDVTNNTTAPELVGATVENDAPYDVVLEFDQNVTGSNAGFTVKVDGTIATIDEFNATENEITLTLASRVMYQDKVTVEYDSATGDITDDYGAANDLASFGPVEATNNVEEVGLNVVEAEATGRTTVNVEFNEEVAFETSEADFIDKTTVMYKGAELAVTDATIETVDGENIIVQLTLDNQLDADYSTGKATVAVAEAAVVITGTEITNPAIAATDIVDGIAPQFVSAEFTAIDTMEITFNVEVDFAVNETDFRSKLTTPVDLTGAVAAVDGDTVTITLAEGREVAADAEYITDLDIAADAVVDVEGTLFGGTTGSKDISNSIAPEYVESVVTDADPSDVALTFTKDMTVDDAAGFTVTVGGEEATISEANVSSDVVTLTLDSNIKEGENVIVDYNTNAVDADVADTTSSANELASFTANDVENKVDAPKFESAEVTASNPGQVAVTFSEAMDSSTPMVSDGFVVTVNSTEVALDSGVVSFSGDGVVTFNLTSATVNTGDDVTIAYDATSGDAADANTNVLESFTAKTVTNNVKQPTFDSIAASYTSPTTTVTMTFSENVSGLTALNNGDFLVTVNGVAVEDTNVTLTWADNNATQTLAFDIEVTPGDEVSVLIEAPEKIGESDNDGNTLDTEVLTRSVTVQ